MLLKEIDLKGLTFALISWMGKKKLDLVQKVISPLLLISKETDSSVLLAFVSRNSSSLSLDENKLYQETKMRNKRSKSYQI